MAERHRVGRGFFITQAIGSSTVIKEQIAAVSLTHAHNGWQQALRDVLSVISQTDLNSDAFKQVNSTVSVIQLNGLWHFHACSTRTWAISTADNTNRLKCHPASWKFMQNGIGCGSKGSGLHGTDAVDVISVATAVASFISTRSHGLTCKPQPMTIIQISISRTLPF